MTTLRPTTLLWRRTRTTMLAATIAISSVLAPIGATALADSGSAVTADGTSGASTFVWEGSSLSDATAIISAGGSNLNMRSEPSLESSVVAKIPHGTVVSLRIDETDTVLDGAAGTRWWPIEYNGEVGWASGQNLADGTGLNSGDTPYEFAGGSLEGVTAQVRADAGLRMRENPNIDAPVVVTIPNGTVIELRINEADTVLDPDGVTRWWPVAFDGQPGWVSGYYLVDPEVASSSTGATSVPEAAVAAPTTQFQWDGSALEGATAIAAGFGENINVRAYATDSSEIVAKVPDGTIVNLRIDRADTVLGPDGDTRWWPVVVDGVDGWVSGYHLSDGMPAPSGDGAADPSTSIFPAGSIAMVQTPSASGLRLRATAGMDAEQIGSLAERSEVIVLNGPVSRENSDNGWFEVRGEGGDVGFVDGDLLVLVATPVTEPETPTPTTTADDDSDADEREQTPTPTEEPTFDPDELDDDSTPTPTATDSASRRSADETPTSTPDDDADSEDENDETPTPQPTQTSDEPQSFIFPVEGATLTQGFGCSSLGFYPYNPDWGCGVHDGVDYAAPAYTPILAVADGTVVTAGWCDCGLGYYVEIDHGGGLHTLYGHMATQPYVSVGQRVSQGETIGPIGSTGLSTGPHIHFMVQINGVTQDPSRYLP